ncbi:shikimate dehydrogenase family protein [Rossellomorea vietnamensis]|uniref:shikimate dehydrogenase family protein n=1 Tax=Rossellomorea vietnamensis TaxID=218284 RepID=UPI001E3A7213|nr:shikimate dehydrogenase [Rossellomorea vietnamensis]
MQLKPAEQPTFYFIGVTTTQSSIMTLFPLWAKELGLEDVIIRGIDIEIQADSSVYREVVDFLKNDPLSMGALVTTHKIDLYQAAKDLFDEMDPYAQLFGELSCISKRDGRLIGHAKDHISSQLAMDAFLPENYWKKDDGEAFIMGAGGSAIAIASNLLDEKNGDNVPSKIYVSNLTKERLESMESILTKISIKVPVEYHLIETAKENDHILQTLKPHSLVVNATGLGKDRPGSPLNEGVHFPENSVVWELNYRGDLLFMEEARDQKQMKNLHVEDGWIYFIHGWTQVISEVFDLTIDEQTFQSLESIAANMNTVKQESAK